MVNKYHKNKEKLRKKARERCNNLSEEEKENRQKKGQADIKIFLNNKKKRSVTIILVFGFYGVYKVIGNRRYLGQNSKNILPFKE